MKHSVPGYVHNCQWDSIQKVQSRIITIIELYRYIFKRKSIPPTKQYWSMCGAHFNKHGPLNGEFGHMTESGLIQPHQFHGIDRELSIIGTNKQLFPKTKWYCGDFLEVMEKKLIRGKFHPRIINYDGVMQPKFGTQYLKLIMKFIDHNIKDKLLLVTNFILTNPYTHSDDYAFTISDTLKQLSSIYWLPDHWVIVPQAYTYEGSSLNNRTEMGMIMFVKEEHNINNITYTPNRRIVKGEQNELQTM